MRLYSADLHGDVTDNLSMKHNIFYLIMIFTNRSAVYSKNSEKTIFSEFFAGLFDNGVLFAL